MQRTIFDPEHHLFRESVGHFVSTAIAPNHARWTEEGKVDKAMFRAAGGQGLLGMAIPEQYGGGGNDDFRYNAVIDEVVTASGASASGLCITLHNDICLPVVEDGMHGFERGRNLDKMGMHAQDTSELFFTDVRVPAANRLGPEGMGFMQLVANLPQERLSIAVGAVAAAEAALFITISYAKERTVFGRPIGRFQHNRFVLAELKTEVDIGRVFVDRLIEDHVAGRLTIEQAAEAKWWTTEMLLRVVDTGVQMHGGHGYMTEYPIAQPYLDARLQTIYGGTTEIMKEIVGRGLGL